MLAVVGKPMMMPCPMYENDGVNQKSQSCAACRTTTSKSGTA